MSTSSTIPSSAYSTLGSLSPLSLKRLHPVKWTLLLSFLPSGNAAFIRADSARESAACDDEELPSTIEDMVVSRTKVPALTHHSHDYLQHTDSSATGTGGTQTANTAALHRVKCKRPEAELRLGS